MVLYSTHCPKCRAIEALQKKKNVAYEVCDDVQKMINLGFKSAPVLDADGRVMKYEEAMKYVMEEL